MDSSHALHCSLHISALRWFWDTAESIAGEPVDRSWGVLLGGVAPSPLLRGFKGLAYVWDVLRCAFLSVLYRLWVRASYALRSHPPSPGPTPLFYEGRHVILATLSSVRETITLDARRVLDGVHHTLRDGTERAESRRSAFFSSSWLAVGWVSATPDSSNAPFNILLSPSFPVRVQLAGLAHPFPHFPV